MVLVVRNLPAHARDERYMGLIPGSGRSPGLILGLGGHVGIGAAQALPLGAAFPPLHPCWKAGQLAMFSRESEVWIFIHSLLLELG